MNKTEMINFLNKNDIKFKQLKDGCIWIESDYITSMCRKDSAQARKTLRLLSKKYNLINTITNKEWKYNDNVGDYIFKGQKVDMVELQFENDKLKFIGVDFHYRFIDNLGYNANSSWANTITKEESLWGMNTTRTDLKVETNV